MKKLTAILTALTMMSASMFTVSADSAYALGDVDMDGVITGHDTGMVAKYVREEAYSLTDEQLVLADVDGDGEVTQADADIMHNDMEVYSLGNIDLGTESPFTVEINDAQAVLNYYSRFIIGFKQEDYTQVQLNLADVNLDGFIGVDDASYILGMYTRQAAYLPVFHEDGRYYW